MFSEAKLSETEEFSVSAHGKGWFLSDHFTLGEFQCKDGADTVLVHPQLVAMLQMIRDHFNAPVRITSAYRTPAYNKRIGGAPDSQHKKGMAADIVVRGVDPADVADFAEDLGAGGVGRYDTFTHVDVWGSMRRWNG